MKLIVKDDPKDKSYGEEILVVEMDEETWKVVKLAIHQSLLDVERKKMNSKVLAAELGVMPSTVEFN
jgi:hypothetical protein